MNGPKRTLEQRYLAPKSPDLSPIENLWSIMKYTISSYKAATNLRMLENQLISIWRGLSTEY